MQQRDILTILLHPLALDVLLYRVVQIVIRVVTPFDEFLPLVMGDIGRNLLAFAKGLVVEALYERCFRRGSHIRQNVIPNALEIDEIIIFEPNVREIFPLKNDVVDRVRPIVPEHDSEKLPSGRRAIRLIHAFLRVALHKLCNGAISYVMDFGTNSLIQHPKFSWVGQLLVINALGVFDLFRPFESLVVWTTGGGDYGGIRGLFPGEKTSRAREPRKLDFVGHFVPLGSLSRPDGRSRFVITVIKF